MKTIIGIILFIVLFTSPFWYSNLMGKANYIPKPVIAEGAGGGCIKDTEYMRAKHMDLLDEWRLEVVRGEGENDRIFMTDSGLQVEKSLTNTCMKCHNNKAEFCDKCHDYTGIDELLCWDCHHTSLEE